MKDQSLRVIKMIATKLSIEKTDEDIKFRVNGEFSKNGVTVRNPKVSIEIAEIDAIVGDETEDDENVLVKMKESLYIESE